MNETADLGALDWTLIIAAGAIIAIVMLAAMTRVPPPRINVEPENDDIDSRYRRHQGEDLL